MERDCQNEKCDGDEKKVFYEGWKVFRKKAILTTIKLPISTISNFQSVKSTRQMRFNFEIIELDLYLLTIWNSYYPLTFLVVEILRFALNVKREF
jgi:hypothetical protein